MMPRKVEYPVVEMECEVAVFSACGPTGISVLMVSSWFVGCEELQDSGLVRCLVKGI